MGLIRRGTVSRRRHHGRAPLAPQPRIHLMCVGRRLRRGSAVLWRLARFREIEVVHHRGRSIDVKMKQNEISRQITRRKIRRTSTKILVVQKHTQDFETLQDNPHNLQILHLYPSKDNWERMSLKKGLITK